MDRNLRRILMFYLLMLALKWGTCIVFIMCIFDGSIAAKSVGFSMIAILIEPIIILRMVLSEQPKEKEE